MIDTEANGGRKSFRVVGKPNLPVCAVPRPSRRANDDEFIGGLVPPGFSGSRQSDSRSAAKSILQQNHY
jgi:hypothetical protein